MPTLLRATATTNMANTNTVVINKPTGTVDGDLMVAFIGCLSSGNSSTVPSGWTLLDSKNSGGASVQTNLEVYYKFASSEGSSYTWVNFGPIAGIIYSLYNTSGEAPTQTTGVGFNTTAGTGASAGSSMTPVRTNEIIIMCAVVADQDIGLGTASISNYKIATDNPTWTETIDTNYTLTSPIMCMGSAYALRPESTATGAPTFDWGASSDRYSAITMFVDRVYSQTTTDTVTLSDSGTTSNVGFNLTVSDSITPTDTITSEKQKTWATQNKSITTWTNQDKS